MDYNDDSEKDESIKHMSFVVSHTYSDDSNGSYFESNISDEPITLNPLSPLVCTTDNIEWVSGANAVTFDDQRLLSEKYFDYALAWGERNCHDEA